MKITNVCVYRSLIALLFVVAGIQKLMSFSDISGFIGSLGVPAPALAAIIVIIIEVPVTLAFAWGYKTRQTGYVLIAFTILATLLVHRDYFGADLVNVLKNIAIIGGIMAAITATCKDCMTHHKNNHSHQ